VTTVSNITDLFTTDKNEVYDDEGLDTIPYSEEVVSELLDEQVPSIVTMVRSWSEFLTLAPGADSEHNKTKSLNLLADIWHDLSDRNEDDPDIFTEYIGVLEYIITKMYDSIALLSRFVLTYNNVEKFGLKHTDVTDVVCKKLAFNIFFSPEALGYEYPQNGFYKKTAPSVYDATCPDDQFRCSTEAELNRIIDFIQMLSPDLKQALNPFLDRSIIWLYGNEENESNT
jgi:hypothetical protein